MPSPFLTKFSALPIISKASQTPLFDHVWPLGSGRNFGKLGFIMFYTLHRSRLCLVSTSQYGRGSKIPHINRKRRIKLFKTGFPFFLWLLYLLHKHGMAMAATCMGFPPINNSPRSQAIHCYQRTEQRSSELPTRHGATLTPLRKPLSHTMEKVSKAGCGATSQLALYPIPVQENMDFFLWMFRHGVYPDMGDHSFGVEACSGCFAGIFPWSNILRRCVSICSLSLRWFKEITATLHMRLLFYKHKYYVRVSSYLHNLNSASIWWLPRSPPGPKNEATERLSWEA